MRPICGFQPLDGSDIPEGIVPGDPGFFEAIMGTPPNLAKNHPD